VLEETKETKETTRCREGGDKVLKETMTKGVLRTMVIDLSDLRTIKPAVEKFLAVESRLDVLFHNAAVMSAPKGSKDKSVSSSDVWWNVWCIFWKD
jgi:retinol dehydrogenase-12